MLALDHLVIAARTLEEGETWVASRLGATPAGGGKHPLMGTHNRVLGLGPGAYLEVLAIDPEAPAPHRPRWFSLDAAEMHARLERGPALVHWVVRSNDIARDVRALPVPLGEILAVSRGNYRWRLTVPADGSLPIAGIFPTFIQWEGAHPADALPDSNCRIESLTLSHPRAREILTILSGMGLSPEAPILADGGEAGISARLRTAGNKVVDVR